MGKLKIGIITHYYKSINFGGNLQSYALVTFLNQQKIDSVQISYKKKNKITLRHILSLLKKMLFVDNYKIFLRNYKIGKFNKGIPHTKTYNADTINSMSEEFDVLISGSDQVWHPQAVCKAYLLSFKTNAMKMSYAASFSVNEIQNKEMYRNALKDYFAISVRENQALGILESMGISGGKWVLDPTLLLDLSEWDCICTKRKIKENYVLCFFLGNDNIERKLALEFAKLHGLKIATLPNLVGRRVSNDKGFGDYKFYNVDPKDLLSLIKYADYVFTDSFHVTVFSHIFKKQFFAFSRPDMAGMENRISSLTDLFGTQNRFCNTKENQTISYIQSLKNIDYNQDFTKFETMKKESINFLMDSIKKAEELHGGKR